MRRGGAVEEAVVVQPVVTGEAVALDLRLAAVPSRILAGVVDVVLQIGLLLALGGLVSAVSDSLSSAASGALGLVAVITVLIGYPVTFEALLRGRTPGKAALGLRVVRDDGGPIGFRQAFVRGLAGAFLERFGITFFFGALATMLLNDRGKRIGDLLAGTVVLQERVTGRGGPVAVMPPGLAGWAATADLTGVSDALALSVRQFVARERQLTDAARADLGGRLLAAVGQAVRPPPPPDAPGPAVLQAVLAERRRRAELRLAAGPVPQPEPQPPPAPPAAPAGPAPPAREDGAAPGGFAPPS